jgi:hypothetical protein
MVTYSYIHTRQQWAISYIEKIEDTKLCNQKALINR